MGEMLLSVGDVARILDLSTERVRGLADEGRLRVVGRTRGGRVFQRSDVLVLLRERTRRDQVDGAPGSSVS